MVRGAPLVMQGAWKFGLGEFLFFLIPQPGDLKQTQNSRLLEGGNVLFFVTLMYYFTIEFGG